MSDPTSDHAREALAELEHARRAGHLPHRNRLSRRRDPAGVRIGRKDRYRSPIPTASVQLGRQALDPPEERDRIYGSSSGSPSGSASSGRYAHPRESVCRNARGRCRRSPASAGSGSSAAYAVTYPCTGAKIPDNASSSPSNFRPQTAKGALFRQASSRRPERPDAGVSLRAITGRQLEHWHLER